MSKPKSCHCCNGSGVENDDLKTGARLKKLRLEAGISQKTIAKGLGLSASMLVFLERGERRWTPDLVYRYEEILFL